MTAFDEYIQSTDPSLNPEDYLYKYGFVKDTWNAAIEAAAHRVEAQMIHSDFIIQNEKLMADKIRKLKE